MKSALLSLLFVLHGAHAADGSVVGRVTALGTNEPLVGVNVLVQGTRRGASTDAQGTFRIEKLPSGSYTLIFSLVGYQRQRLTDVIVNEGEETLLTVLMKESPLQTDQVVVTASKREQSLQEVPVSISVIDAAEIRTRNNITLDDALRYVPGVNLTGQQINIRGSSGYSLGGGSRVLMLVDGIPFITGDTGELIYEMIPTTQIDRIEVVKGASSALYGSNALGGVVNIITKPITERPETFVRAYGGFYNKPSYDQWKWSDKTRFLHGQSAGFTRKAGDLGIALSASRQIDDGYRQNDFRRRFNIALKARYDFEPTTAFTLNAGFLHENSGRFVFWRSLDSALIPPATNLTDNQKATRYYASGLFNMVISEKFLLTTKSLWSHNRWGYQQFLDGARSYADVDDIRLEVSGRIAAGERHTVTAGIDASLGLISGETFAKRTIGGGALYGQDEISLTNELMLTLGFRLDLQSVGLTDEKPQVNPKLALAYTPRDGTTFRASFGRGFRIPSVAEAFIVAGGGLIRGVPNAELKPERSTSYEAGVSHLLAEGASLDAAVFRSEYSNMIEPGLSVGGENIQVQWRNVTRARVQGVETSVRAGFFDNHLVASLGYTYIYPEDLTQQTLLKYRPRHLLYTTLAARFGWLNLGGDFRFVSKVDRIDDELVSSGIIPDGNERADILVADVRIGAEVPMPGFTLAATLNVRNAFQRNYVEVIGNLMPPRTYLLSLDAQW